MALAAISSASGPAAADPPRPSASSTVAWGARAEGALGNRTTLRRTTPVTVCAVGTTDCEATSLSKVVSVSAGAHHNLALLSNGTVVSWGENDHGQLGDGTRTNRPGPVPVCAVVSTNCATGRLQGVVAIAAGDSHNLALLNDGTVVAWGNSNSGRLGIGYANEDRTTPTPVCDVDCAAGPLTGVTSIAAGGGHSLALRTGGAVVSWGWNGSGQLGNPVPNNSDRPVVTCAVGATDCTANPLTGVTAIAAGGQHSLGVLTDGGAIAWGDNQLGQLGDDSTSSRTTPARVCAVGATDCAAQPLTDIATVDAGGYVSLALRTNGTAVGWGLNVRGQLGDGTTNNRRTPAPVCAAGATDCAAQPLSGIASISTSGGHGLAVSTTGAAFAWGLGVNGQLGDRSTADRTTPVPVCAVKADDCATSPLTGARAASAGSGHSATVLADGTVRTWGDHQYGQIGDGAISGVLRPDVVCAPGSTDCATDRLTGVTAVSANGAYYGGGGHSLALQPDGVVLSWGGNGLGQLGDGTYNSRDLPGRVCAVEAKDCATEPLTGATAIATGVNHSLALMSDGTVVAWGRNGVGNLGNGTWQDSATPTHVCAGGEQNCKAPLTGVVAIAAGGDHSLALLNDGTVVGWGSNYFGQLGDGTGGPAVQAQNMPVRVCAVGATDCAANPLRGVVAIEAGGGPSGFGGHSMALLSSGAVVSWGNNASGQLGDGTTTTRIRPVRVCAVGATDCAASPLTGVTAIEAAGHHSAAVQTGGTVAAWGENTSGQLGDATTTHRSTPVRVCAVGATNCAENPLTGVTVLALGYSHAVAVGANGAVLSWGSNWTGQLGDGTTTDRSAPGWVCAPQAANCAASPLTGVTAIASGYNHTLAVIAPA
ncbi:RCC1 domain-containing protein [Lentzea tibetensis]|uniref:RCC1 domain-containing protein n=1 Tax=Lentzea tibetensis TaxID=2591470 RepID=UPI0016447A00|nr:RCC1 repeat-containing protein [Lentzea tibetensis]